MYSCYKSLRITYYAIAALFIVLAGLISYHNGNLMVPVLIIVLVLVAVEIIVLTVIALKWFNKEVMSCIYDCNVREYMDRLDKRMGKVRGAAMKSSYADYSALGYSMLGDYDSVFDCCQKITSKQHKTDYYRFMLSFYLDRGLIDQAEKTLCDLRAFRTTLKNPRLIKLCEQNITEAEYALNMKKGILDGVEEYYLSKYSDENLMKIKITKVSYAHAIGKVLVLKGQPDRAKEYLKFASENGGDTKYTALANALLSQI